MKKIKKIFEENILFDENIPSSIRIYSRYAFELLKLKKRKKHST